MGISQRIELRHVRAFVAVAEELSFRAAAERLSVSQPPLSRTIQQLERLIGRSLFERSRQGVALSAAGAALLPRARKLLDAVEKTFAELPPTGPGPGPVTGSCAGVFFAVHPRAQADLRAATGATDIEVGRTHELIAAVRQGRLAAALVMLPAATGGLAVQQIGEAEMCAAIPSKHPLARRRTLAVSDLDAFPRLLFLGRRQNAPLHAHLDAALRRRGLANPRYSVPRDTYSGLSQIADGQACTVLCSWLRDFVQAGVTLRPFRKADRMMVGIGWVTRQPDATTALAVARVMRTLFQGRTALADAHQPADLVRIGTDPDRQSVSQAP